MISNHSRCEQGGNSIGGQAIGEGVIVDISKYLTNIIDFREDKKEMVDTWIEGKLLPINKINGDVEELYLNINTISQRFKGMNKKMFFRLKGMRRHVSNFS
jgi:hypothetical protein